MLLRKILAKISCLSIFMATSLFSTPSSVFWTNCTTDILETGKGHIDFNAYFSVFNGRHHGEQLPADIGLLVGLFTWRDWSCEGGIDYLGGTDDPLYFNIGLGIGENKLATWAPSCKIGLFNAGTRYRGQGRTSQNIFDLIVGRTLPESIGSGKVFIGGFAGMKAMGKNRGGFMVAYEQFFSKKIYCDNKEYYAWEFAVDYASGKNTIGGAGVCLGYYFTPNISLLTGPTWFNTAKYNGKWKWSIQLGANFDLFTPKSSL